MVFWTIQIVSFQSVSTFRFFFLLSLFLVLVSLLRSRLTVAVKRKKEEEREEGRIFGESRETKIRLFSDLED